jgi:ribosomal protein S18 acetylase RimI-like enzyme
VIEEAIAARIEPLSAARISSFREALDKVAREGRYLAMLEAPPLALVAPFVLDNLAAGAVYYVAIVSEHVVGWADIIPSRIPIYSHGGTLGMGVLPRFRGQGLGKRLIEACIARAWENGLARIQLEVRADNHAALRLYEKCGFRREGIKVRAMRFDGQDFDAVHMALLR